MNLDLRSAIATFGVAARSKLANPGARGEPEDQLRSPLEHLLADLGELSGIPRSEISAVGESSSKSSPNPLCKVVGVTGLFPVVGVLESGAVINFGDA